MVKKGQNFVHVVCELPLITLAVASPHVRGAQLKSVYPTVTVVYREKDCKPH